MQTRELDLKAGAINTCDAAQPIGGGKPLTGVSVIYRDGETKDLRVRSQLPTDSATRKEYPIFRGVFCYFPDAIAEVARVSKVGNDQHNPGQPMHWAREKSTDHEDCMIRHLLESGTIDTDGIRHTAKVAWRALALLQTEIENARSLQNG